MKDKQNERLRTLAKKIVELESEIRLGKNVQEYQQKIENIISTLSIEDVVYIDDYIFRKKLFDK